jgi:hypothetical protein
MKPELFFQFFSEKKEEIVDAMMLHHSQSNATKHNENQHKGPEPIA